MGELKGDKVTEQQNYVALRSLENEVKKLPEGTHGSFDIHVWKSGAEVDFQIMKDNKVLYRNKTNQGNLETATSIALIDLKQWQSKQNGN